MKISLTWIFKKAVNLISNQCKAQNEGLYYEVGAQQGACELPCEPVIHC